MPPPSPTNGTALPPDTIVDICGRFGHPWFACINLCESLEQSALWVLLALIALNGGFDIVVNWLEGLDGVRGALALCVKGTLAKGGLLSFIMFVIATDNRVGEDWREVIELMHLVLFVTVVLYLVQVGVLASIRNGIVREWLAAAATWGDAPPVAAGGEGNKSISNKCSGSAAKNVDIRFGKGELHGEGRFRHHGDAHEDVCFHVHPRKPDFSKSGVVIWRFGRDTLLSTKEFSLGYKIR